MFIQSLRLHDFRSYHEVTLTPPRGTTVLAGENGTGVVSTVRTFDPWWADVIAVPREKEWNSAHKFGSAHAGVCNFLLGDGSVRAVSTTTPHEVLYALSVVNDGETTQLP